MISPHLIDQIGMALALIVPAYVVLRFPRWQTTVLLGALSFWLILVAVGQLLAVLDPNRDARMLDAIWLLVGWIPGLTYAWLLYGIRLCFLRIVRSRHPLTHSPHNGNA